MARTIATVGDLYGPDAGSTFYNQNNGAIVGPAGTNNTSTGGAPADQAGGSSGAAMPTVSTLNGIQGTIWGNGVFQWFLIATTLIAMYALAKRFVPNVESGLAVPRVSVPSFLSIGVQSFLFLVLVKTLLKKYNIPGLSGMAAHA